VTRRFLASTWPFSKAAPAGPATCTATYSAIGKSAAATRVISTASCCWASPTNRGEAFTAALKRQGGQFFPGEEKLTGGIANLDDYSHCEISQKQDSRDLFVTPFYFGCEADDPCCSAANPRFFAGTRVAAAAER